MHIHGSLFPLVISPPTSFSCPIPCNPKQSFAFISFSLCLRPILLPFLRIQVGSLELTYPLCRIATKPVAAMSRPLCQCMPTSSTSITAVHYIILRPQQSILIRVSSSPRWFGNGSSLGQFEHLACICATTCSAKARWRWRKHSGPGWNDRSGRPPCINVQPVYGPLHLAYLVFGVTWRFHWSVFLSTSSSCNSPHPLSIHIFTSLLVAPSLSRGRSRRVIPSLPWFFILLSNPHPL